MTDRPVRLEVADGGLVTPVVIGSGVLRSELPEILSALGPATARTVIISRRVAKLWGDQVRDAAGGAALWVEIDDAEEAKTLSNASGVLDRIISAGVRRDWSVVCVGGGVTGDLGGFVASVALRGLRLVHVPTTVLAQVDSSIGGKTGVNHAAGKNLIGTFHPAHAVVSDIDLLSTLDGAAIRCGLFEALKSGVIADADLFEHVTAFDSTRFDPSALQKIIAGAAAVKCNIVTGDPRETGDRRLLNYGHTLGHALEKCLDYRDLSHGDAVGWGMLAANAMGVASGSTKQDVAARIESAIRALGPACPARAVSEAELVIATRLDKKFDSDRMRIVVPRDIGSASVIEVTLEQLELGAAALVRSLER